MNTLHAIETRTKILIIGLNATKKANFQSSNTKYELSFCQEFEAGFQMLQSESIDIVAIEIEHDLSIIENLILQFPKINLVLLSNNTDSFFIEKAFHLGVKSILAISDLSFPRFDQQIKILKISLKKENLNQFLNKNLEIANWYFYPQTGTLRITERLEELLKGSSSSIPDFIYRYNQELTRNKYPIEKIIHYRPLYSDEKRLLVRAFYYEEDDVIIGSVENMTRWLNPTANTSNRDYFREIFEKSTDAILYCNNNGEIVDVNIATEQLLETKESILQGMQVDDFIEEDFNYYLDKINAGSPIVNQVLNTISSLENIRTCTFTGGLSGDQKGEGIYLIFKDITEIIKAEKITKARNAARESSKLKEQFIASISHEMRTPMNAIYGMSKLLAQSKMDKEQKEYVDSIQESSELLLGIVNDILDMATLEKGDIHFENKTFSLFKLVTNIENVMGYKLKEKQLKFEIKYENNVPEMVSGDKLRLNQILFNLIGNSIKFTDTGYVKLSISCLSLATESVRLKFSIEDTGIGIPSDKIGLIFEAFSRVRDKNRIYEGTGLGLSISKSLIESQGGKIWAESEFGKGSTFHFDMVLEISDSTKLDTKQQTVFIDKDFELKVLLVEDHKINQLVAKKTLIKQWPNINLTIADHGKIAIKILEKESFDLILMDIQMPIMDGYETINYIRNKMPERANIPVLAMTAHAHIAKEEQFKTYGFDDFVLKPFEPEHLFKKIKNNIFNK